MIGGGMNFQGKNKNKMVALSILLNHQSTYAYQSCFRNTAHSNVINFEFWKNFDLPKVQLLSHNEYQFWQKVKFLAPKYNINPICFVPNKMPYKNSLSIFLLPKRLSLQLLLSRFDRLTIKHFEFITHSITFPFTQI